MSDVDFYSTADGEITWFDPPRGPGWQWADASREGDGFYLSELKMRLLDAGRVLFLYAKAYEGDTDSLEVLRQRDWVEYYASLFSAHPSVSVEDGSHDGLPCLRVLATGSSKDGVPQFVRERYTPTPDCMLIESASGSLSLLDEQREAIDRFFRSVVFSAASAPRR